MGHDERFKLLLREFLREFFELFFPDLVGRLDFAAAVWLQQEPITDPPAGEKRTIDLLAPNGFSGLWCKGWNATQA